MVQAIKEMARLRAGLQAIADAAYEHRHSAEMLASHPPQNALAFRLRQMASAVLNGRPPP